MVKEYKLFKTAKKTAKENNLILVDGHDKKLFDFSILDGVEIPEEEKEVIKENALKNVSCAFSEAFYGENFNNFHWCDGVVRYTDQCIYSKDTGKRLYVIFSIAAIRHNSYTRKSVHDNADISTYKHVYTYTDHREIEI